MKRGDIVLADFPFQDVPGSKIRPALVVQNDTDNARLANTVLAMITGNLAGQGHPTNVLIDPVTATGKGSGLRGPSLVKCGNLVTIRQHVIIQHLGELTPLALQQVDAALKAALSLP